MSPHVNWGSRLSNVTPIELHGPWMLLWAYDELPGDDGETAIPEDRTRRWHYVWKPKEPLLDAWKSVCGRSYMPPPAANPMNTWAMLRMWFIGRDGHQAFPSSLSICVDCIAEAGDFPGGAFP